MDEIEKMKEWQKHQYDPGHWTNGRMPYFIFNKKYKKVTIAVIILFAMVFLMSFL